MSRLSKDQRTYLESAIMSDGVYETIDRQLTAVLEDADIPLTDNQYICWEIKIKRTIGEDE